MRNARKEMRVGVVAVIVVAVSRLCVAEIVRECVVIWARIDPRGFDN